MSEYDYTIDLQTGKFKMLRPDGTTLFGGLSNGSYMLPIELATDIINSETAQLRADLAAAQAENAQLKAALQPFADDWQAYLNKEPEYKAEVSFGEWFEREIFFAHLEKDFRRADDLLNDHASETAQE